MKNLKTNFLSPELSSHDEILRQCEIVNGNHIVRQLITSSFEPAIVLNSNRQIIALNQHAQDVFKAETADEIIGWRFGDAIECIHKDEFSGGCGTSKFCRECGVSKTIAVALSKNIGVSEIAKITSIRDGAIAGSYYKVETIPFKLDGLDFLISFLADITNDKIRVSLERTFLHDVINTANAVKGLTELLNDAEDIVEMKEYGGMLKESIDELLKEIFNHRDLIGAETGALDINPKPVFVNFLLKRIAGLYSAQKLAQDIDFSVDYLENDFEIKTDVTLLIRSLGNLTKNALEASQKGDSVRLYSDSTSHEIFFNVFNSRTMTRENQLKILKKEFSTKEESGHGIGMYSVKLFVEKYLGGRVYFISKEETGTIFTIQLNKDISAN